MKTLDSNRLDIPASLPQWRQVMRRQTRIKTRAAQLSSKTEVQGLMLAWSKLRSHVKWNKHAKQCIRMLKGRIASHSSLDAFAAWKSVAWRRKIAQNKVRGGGRGLKIEFFPPVAFCVEEAHSSLRACYGADLLIGGVSPFFLSMPVSTASYYTAGY